MRPIERISTETTSFVVFIRAATGPGAVTLRSLTAISKMRGPGTAGAAGVGTKT